MSELSVYGWSVLFSKWVYPLSETLHQIGFRFSVFNFFYLVFYINRSSSFRPAPARPAPARPAPVAP